MSDGLKGIIFDNNVPDGHFLDGLPDEEGPVGALQSPHRLIVHLELALSGLDVEVVEADPRLLQDLVQAAEEVRVLGHGQVGEEVLAGEDGGAGLLVEERELQLHPGEEGVAQAGQPLHLPLCNVPDTRGLQHSGHEWFATF